MHEKNSYRVFGIFFLAILILAPFVFGQDNGRKVKVRVEPVYPEIARRMHLVGTVKLQVTVTAAGLVRSSKVLGGNPLFLESAKTAVSKWKFEPADKETIELIAFDFH